MNSVGECFVPVAIHQGTVMLLVHVHCYNASTWQKRSGHTRPKIVGRSYEECISIAITVRASAMPCENKSSAEERVFCLTAGPETGRRQVDASKIDQGES
jgi:hypothetical protein